MRMQSNRNKLLASALVVGVLGGLVALGVSGAFSATTQNAGNEIRTGTVALTDNDAGTAMFNVDNAKPGDTFTRCIKVSYGGSLPADVRLYTQTTPAPIMAYMNIKVESGTQATSSFPSCTGFTAGETVYNGPFTGVTFVDYATGLHTNPASQDHWNQNDALVYQVTVSLSSSMPDSIQNATTGNVTAVWEARDF